MINFKDVTKQYGTADPVLKGVNFVIEKGTFAYLIGPTGSGKTTIFRLIIRDLLPSEGAITLGEWDLATLPHSKIPNLRRHVGVVFQDLKLLLDRTVTENVMLPLEFAGANEEARNRAEAILEEVGLGEKKDKFPAQLSGGERQRVAIARALVFDPEIILADEPTGNLDSQTSFQILDLLKSINSRGTTIFMATHNDKLINDLEDRVIVLKSGVIVEDRKPKSKHEASKAKPKHEAKHEEKDEKEEKKEDKKEKKSEESESHEKIKLSTLAEKSKEEEVPGSAKSKKDD